MKKAILILLVLGLCLCLCACGGGGGKNGENQPNATTNIGNNEWDTSSADTENSNLDSIITYDHTLLHPLVSSLNGDWIIDVPQSGYVMPAKITFYEDGTCDAELTEHTDNRTTDWLWGIVPDSVEDGDNLYIRIGTENDIIYLFHITRDKGYVAFHAAVGELDFAGCPLGFEVDGLSEDCYTGMWFQMNKTGA